MANPLSSAGHPLLGVCAVRVLPQASSSGTCSAGIMCTVHSVSSVYKEMSMRSHLHGYLVSTFSILV